MSRMHPSLGKRKTLGLFINPGISVRHMNPGIHVYLPTRRPPSFLVSRPPPRFDRPTERISTSATASLPRPNYDERRRKCNRSSFVYICIVYTLAHLLLFIRHDTSQYVKCASHVGHERSEICFSPIASEVGVKVAGTPSRGTALCITHIEYSPQDASRGDGVF